MKERIYPKNINGKIYYYLQYTYRKKINDNDNDNACGKGSGTGKSQACTHSEYLGSADKIRKILKRILLDFFELS